MKTFILFGVLCAVLLVGVHAEWDDDEEACVHELKLDKHAMKALDDLEIVPEDNHDYNKFLECTWKKEGTLDDDGKVKWDKVDDILLEEFKKDFGDDPKLSEFITSLVIVGAVEECKEETDTTSHTLAKFQNCVMKKLQKLAEDKD